MSKETQDRLESALYEMVFAYENKDDDMPHTFEIEALSEAFKLVTDRDKKVFIAKVSQSARYKL